MPAIERAPWWYNRAVRKRREGFDQFGNPLPSRLGMYICDESQFATVFGGASSLWDLDEKDLWKLHDLKESELRSRYGIGRIVPRP